MRIPPHHHFALPSPHLSPQPSTALTLAIARSKILEIVWFPKDRLFWPGDDKTPVDFRNRKSTRSSVRSSADKTSSASAARGRGSVWDEVVVCGESVSLTACRACCTCFACDDCTLKIWDTAFVVVVQLFFFFFFFFFF